MINEQIYTDGTKIEANAIGTLLSGRNQSKPTRKDEKAIGGDLDCAQSVAVDEDMILSEPPTATTIDKQSVKATVEKNSIKFWQQ